LETYLVGVNTPPSQEREGRVIEVVDKVMDIAGSHDIVQAEMSELVTALDFVRT
jgi:F0F1-type ATP synthase alpha subunit